MVQHAVCPINDYPQLARVCRTGEYFRREDQQAFRRLVSFLLLASPTPRKSKSEHLETGLGENECKG